MLHNILCVFNMYLIYNIYCYNMFYIIKIILNRNKLTAIFCDRILSKNAFLLYILLTIPKSPQPYIDYLIITYLADMYPM